MFFYISQLFSFLVMPLTSVLILLVAGQIIREGRWKKRLQVAGVVLLLVVSNNFLANLLINYWEPPFKSISDLAHYEVGIVLTGVTNLSKTAEDRTFFSHGADRATHAIQLYKEKKLSKILITGGQGLDPVNDQKEARKLAEFMVIAGVLPEDIIVEDAAKNTRENAVFTKEMLEAYYYPTDQPYLLITSAFHMFRAEGCFKKVGLQVDTFPVDYYGNDRLLDYTGIFQPSPNALLIWHKLFKEWLGIAAYRLAGYM
ncbi:MAG: YdcF family protein [Lunatimonas sp.]|uniref:YdcF family protein n=1 Tax=Lunatimonas sp. TaxID=2060141 RepID=UPI00263A575E|nr:YdcF family protein [Lunatimonas sp.]MCC5938687.1 YdcF family protein [Lunatimonas sp.]